MGIGWFQVEAWHHPFHLLTAHSGCCAENRPPGLQGRKQQGAVVDCAWKIWAWDHHFSWESGFIRDKMKIDFFKPILNLVNSFVFMKPYSMIWPAQAFNKHSPLLSYSWGCCSCYSPPPPSPLPRPVLLQGYYSLVSFLGWLFSWEPAYFPLLYIIHLIVSPCLLLLANSLPLARVQGHVAAASICSYPYFHIPHQKGKLLFSFTFVSHFIEWRATNKQYRMQMHHLKIRRKKSSLKFTSSVLYFCFHEWKNIYMHAHMGFSEWNHQWLMHY